MPLVKLLLIGGSGRVGSFCTPYLKERHSLRVLDPRPPRHEGVEHVEGTALDEDAVRRAVDGVDAFIWMAMLSPQGGSVTTQNVPTILNNYDVNCKSLHLFLYVAQEAGVKRGVYTSTMSAHYRERAPYPSGKLYDMEELTPLDTPSVYGRPHGSRIYATDEEDLADAYSRAVDAVQIGHGRFDAVFIAGDETEEDHNLTKAKRLLGWEPRSHRYLKR